MEQVYIHFRQSMFTGKRDKETGDFFDVKEELPERIHPVDAYIPIPKDSLPPIALEYYDLTKLKGFVREGNPILYVTANDVTEIKDNGKRDNTNNLIAEWPAFRGNLQKTIGNKGFINLHLHYFTKPADYESFEKLKDSCRMQDLTLNNNYNTCDLLQMIENADWNAKVVLSVKKMADSFILPALKTLGSNSDEDFERIRISSPQIREPVGEGVSIEYSFGNNLILINSRAFEDVLNVERGILGYDEVVRQYFNGRIPMQLAIYEKSLEAMVQEILPLVIDSMTSFVEN